MCNCRRWSAGLNAALVLGRSRRKVILFDNNSPRNAVTQKSHGFITRDGIRPNVFREIAHQDIAQYSSVQVKNVKIVEVKNKTIFFELHTDGGEIFQAKKIILSTGLKEILPSVNHLSDYYGKTLFSCPYCDGWELKDKPLILISENHLVFHMAKIVYNWSKYLVVCTNGNKNLTAKQLEVLRKKGIKVNEQIIKMLAGKSGLLESVIFENNGEIKREGGFVTPKWVQASSFGESLGCNINDLGGIVTDDFGRTNVEGVYAAGDTSVIAPSQLIIAAGEGSRAAIGVNSDLTEDYWTN